MVDARPNYEVSVKNLVDEYDSLVGRIDRTANTQTTRAVGGVLRSGKGNLVESLAKGIVTIAWRETGKPREHLLFRKQKIKIPIRSSNAQSLPAHVAQHIEENRESFFYMCGVDLHVCVKDEFVLGIECKSFTENAMYKRILVDFWLLKTRHQNLQCVLLQLESQLGGDYSEIASTQIVGSRSSRTLDSYFPNVNLDIITLLEGERHVERPIHKTEYFKPLTAASVEGAITRIKTILETAP